MAGSGRMVPDDAGDVVTAGELAARSDVLGLAAAGS